MVTLNFAPWTYPSFPVIRSFTLATGHLLRGSGLSSFTIFYDVSNLRIRISFAISTVKMLLTQFVQIASIKSLPLMVEDTLDVRQAFRYLFRIVGRMAWSWEVWPMDEMKWCNRSTHIVFTMVNKRSCVD